MDSRRIKTGQASQFVQPLLNSLNRMRGQDRLRPEMLNGRAEELLCETWGAQGGPAQTAFAHASVDLMVEHTRYFDGIALLLPVPEGCSVAVRESQSDVHEVVLGAAEGTLDNASEQRLRRMMLETLEVHCPDPVELAVVSNLPRFLHPLVVEPAMVAAVRALSALLALDAGETEMIDALGHPKGPDRHVVIARMMAARQTTMPTFVLTDSREREFIALDVPPMERPGMALVAPVESFEAPPRGEGRKALREIMAQLREGPFPALESVRDIEHRDLAKAVSAVDRKHKGMLNFLVTENGRVQRMVTAIQRRDWQMFGALLLMSHAGKKNDLGLSDPGSDAVVTAVENMSLEGMYGGSRVNADTRAVIVTGQQYSVPPALEKLQASFQKEFDTPLATLLL